MISENNLFRKLKDYLKKEANTAQQRRVKANINVEVHGTMYDSWEEGLEEGKFLMADKLLSFVESMEREVESREYVEKLSSMKQSSSGDNEWIPTNINLPKETKIVNCHKLSLFDELEELLRKRIDKIENTMKTSSCNKRDAFHRIHGLEDAIYELLEYFEKHPNLQVPPVAIEQTVYRINEGAKEPIIPMTVIEVSQRIILKGEPFWQITAMDMECGNTITYPELQFNRDVFFSKEDAEEELRFRLTERVRVSEEIDK